MQIQSIKKQALAPVVEYTKEASELIKEHLYAKNTLSTYAPKIARFDAFCGGAEPTPAMYQAFLLLLAKTMKKSTLDLYAVAIGKKYPELAHQNKLFAKALRNKKSKESNAKHSKPLLPAVFEQKYTSLNAKYRLLFLLQIKGAFRISELLALRWCDIKQEKKGLEITLQTTKTQKEGAIVGVNFGGLPLKEAFDVYFAMCFGDVPFGDVQSKELVFGKLSRYAVNKMLKKTFGNEYSTHSLRSGHITHAIEKGASLAIVQKASRHKNLNVLTTNYYNPATSFDNTSDLL